MVQNLQSKHCDKNKFLKKQIKKKEVKEFLSLSFPPAIFFMNKKNHARTIRD